MSHYSKLNSECNDSMWGCGGNRCGATIWSPSLDGHFVEDRAFSLYAMECEGDTSTRQGKINKVIKLMAAVGSMCNDFDVQCQIYDEVGIDSDTFTNEEIDYIEREVARHLGY